MAEDEIAAILRHTPRTLEEYRLARIAEWSQPRYALDKRFTQLTLLVDQGPEAQGERWQAQQKPFTDLRDVLAAAPDRALVVLGPPGCGKSTLLRRLELDLGVAALRGAEPGQAPLTFFVSLSRHHGPRPHDPPPLPRQWLAHEWSLCSRNLPPFDEVLDSGRLILLLDAVNEIPHADAADYSSRIALWRDFLAELPRGTRIVFSCRSLDYSALLSTPDLPVPQVRIEQMSDLQVEEFLRLYDPQGGAARWQQLRGTPQLDLYRSPFYLRLLVAQAGAGGAAVQGRAALFTGFVRQALRREIEAGNPLFLDPDLLSNWERGRSARCEWSDDDPYELPEDGCLFVALSTFARDLQIRRRAGSAQSRGDVASEARVRVRRREALALLDARHGEALLSAGLALQVLDVDRRDVLFIHQLFQEYFAARAVAATPQPDLAASAWRADEVSPTHAEVLAGLADSDPLPAAPSTGWEESFVLAAAMTPAPEAFVAAVMAVHLPLAGRCAAQSDVAVSGALRRRLQQALVARSRDPQADLRARIAAARALGELGDPRFERRRGADGDYLLPPLLDIAAGTYTIGSDEGLYEDEAPVHEVKLDAYAIGRFPVTNAEWRLFIDAGGYDDGRWWQTEAAQRWRRGEGASEGPKQQWRQNRQWLQDDPRRIDELHREGKITSKQAEDWEKIRVMPGAEFDALLDDWYPSGRQVLPERWNDPAYNDPGQPVVGICWHEARAYCAWLSVQSGQVWRLPSEAEWEAAARGRSGRRYAWGDDFDTARCNTFESHVRGTTPIGVFPGGDTPEGVVDLTGNVWEWTGSAYLPYPCTPDPAREDPAVAMARRVVRGGSWGYGRGNARCAYRVGFVPGDRDNDLGLRLVCVSPILKR